MRIASGSWLAVCILGVSLASRASADPTPSPDVHRMVNDDCAKARKAGKTCVLDIVPEDVDGKVPTLTETTVNIVPFGGHGSLIHIRHDFIFEIVKTAEDL